MCDYSSQLYWTNWNIIIGIEFGRYCLIILKENTIIFQVNKGGKDMCDYTRQLCQSSYQHYSRERKEERLHNYLNIKYNNVKTDTEDTLEYLRRLGWTNCQILRTVFSQKTKFSIIKQFIYVKWKLHTTDWLIIPSENIQTPKKS